MTHTCPDCGKTCNCGAPFNLFCVHCCWAEDEQPDEQKIKKGDQDATADKEVSQSA